MNLPAPRVLVVYDDFSIQKQLARYMQEQGFTVHLAPSCSELQERLVSNQVDLIVLDVMLPDGSGLDICRDLRAARSRVPIILLTALKGEVDRIIGLEIGADDFLGKPFNPRELVARMRAILRRCRSFPSEQLVQRLYRFEGFVADASNRTLTDPAGSAVPLTGGEFNLLVAFLDRPGRVLSSSQLLDFTHSARP